MNTEQVRDLDIGLANKADEYKALLADCRAKHELWTMLGKIFNKEVVQRVFYLDFENTLRACGVSNLDALEMFADGVLTASCEADKKLVNHPCHHPAKLGADYK